MAQSVDWLCVPPANVLAFRPFVSHLIQSALERAGSWTEGEIWDDLEHERSLLWLVMDGPRIEAAIVTQIRINAKLGKVCEVVCCAGYRMARWVGFFVHIESYARDEGCKIMRVPGRKGWARVLRDYRQPHVVLEKELN